MTPWEVDIRKTNPSFLIADGQGEMRLSANHSKRAEMQSKPNTQRARSCAEYHRPPKCQAINLTEEIYANIHRYVMLATLRYGKLVQGIFNQRRKIAKRRKRKEIIFQFLSKNLKSLQLIFRRVYLIVAFWVNNILEYKDKTDIAKRRMSYRHTIIPP